MSETEHNDQQQVSPAAPEKPAQPDTSASQAKPDRETGADRSEGSADSEQSAAQVDSAEEPKQASPTSDEPKAEPAQEKPATESSSEKFAEALRDHDKVLPTPNVGQRLHAKVLTIGPEHAFVDYGGRSEASIETAHLKNPEGEVTVKVGDKIEAYVVSNEDGVILAPSLTPPPNEGLKLLQEAQKSNVPVSGKVTGVNAGGLDVEIAENRAFCPVSQIDLTYCPDPSVFVGQTHDFRILEIREGGRRIVVSRRALLQQQKDEIADRILQSLHVGEVREGTVVRTENFGAFVDLGGIDGMVHVSEIAHERVNRPADVLTAGDKVRVQILEIGKDSKGRNRISLSIKAAQQDPWLTITEDIQEGATLTGKIVRLADFGAFVRLRPGIEGLVHVSEIQDERVAHPRDVLKEGDEAKVRVVGVDPRRRRVSLTMRIEPGTSAKGPRVGETVDGVARAHKPYGVFVDLPDYGPRASGLLPLEEAGVTRGAELSKRFPAGEKIKVLVQQIDEKGRIRLAIPTGAPGQAAPSLGSRGVTSAMADALRRALGQDGEAKKE